MIKKTCSRCKVLQPLEDFKKRKISKDGRYSWCKACERIRQKTWRLNNPEKARAAGRRALEKYLQSEKGALVNKQKRKKYQEKCRANITPQYIYRLLWSVCPKLTIKDLLENPVLIELYQKKLTLRRKVYDNQKNQYKNSEGCD